MAITRYQFVNKNASAAVTDPTNELIVAGPGETPQQVANRKTANNALPGVSRITGPTGLSLRVSANPASKTISFEVASPTTETLKIEAVSGTSFLLANSENSNLQSGTAYPAGVLSGQGAYTQQWAFGPRAGIAGSGVPNERILVTISNGTRVAKLSFLPFTASRYTLVTASTAQTVAYRIDGPTSITEGGAAGGYFVTETLSDGTEQPYVNGGTYTLVPQYPVGASIVSGPNTNAAVSLPTNTITGDGYMSVRFTLPSGFYIQRQIYLRDSASSVSVPNYTKFSRIAGTTQLIEGGVAGNYSVVDVRADTTEIPYTGNGTFTLTSPYPNGTVITPGSNGQCSFFIPANTIQSDVVLTLNYTFPSGHVIKRFIPVLEAQSTTLPNVPEATGSETWVALQTTGTVGQLASSSSLSQSPTLGNISVYIGGFQDIGNGVKTGSCYFSGDNGVTARLKASITVGDKLYWNGNIAGFNLDPSDTIVIYYGTPTATP